MYGNVIAYLRYTQKCSRSRAYWHWSRCSPERRDELIQEAKRWQSGSSKKFETRSDFVGAPTRRPLFD